MQFTADQVWACAAAAQRINEGYFKEPVYADTLDVIAKQANKVMVKDWLRTNSFGLITEQDYAAGRSARDHFKSYTLLALTGRINEFQTTAMRLAAKEEFTGRDMYDFAVISCLPSVASRDTARTELKRDIYASEQLQGNVGDTVVGEITVISTRFYPEYNKHKITARMGESFIDFWFAAPLEGSVGIKGKIKNVRGDKTTALNYVKLVG